MPADEKSIIKIIQKMVQDNEPEQKIVETLQSMGVEQDQAKRLLLIAQADTFTLLGAELDKIVAEKMAVQKEILQKESAAFINNVLEQKKKEIRVEMEKELLRYKTDLFDNQKKFQDSINESIEKIAKLNEQSYAMSEENKKMIETVNKDLSETKLKGIKVRRSIARTMLMVFGIAAFLAAGGLIVYTLFVTQFNMDHLTSAIVLAIIGAALTYLSTNI